MDNHKKKLFGLIGVLAVVYVLLMFVSLRGWGYPGYRGYARGGTFLYWGGPRGFYPGQSVRGGSVGGTRALGGGPQAGK